MSKRRKKRKKDSSHMFDGMLGDMASGGKKRKKRKGTSANMFDGALADFGGGKEKLGSIASFVGPSKADKRNAASIFARRGSEDNFFTDTTGRVAGILGERDRRKRRKRDATPEISGWGPVKGRKTPDISGFQGRRKGQDVPAISGAGRVDRKVPDIGGDGKRSSATPDIGGMGNARRASDIPNISGAGGGGRGRERVPDISGSGGNAPGVPNISGAGEDGGGVPDISGGFGGPGLDRAGSGLLRAGSAAASRARASVMAVFGLRDLSPQEQRELDKFAAEAAEYGIPADVVEIRREIMLGEMTPAQMWDTPAGRLIQVGRQRDRSVRAETDFDVALEAAAAAYVAGELDQAEFTRAVEDRIRVTQAQAAAEEQQRMDDLRATNPTLYEKLQRQKEREVERKRRAKERLEQRQERGRALFRTIDRLSGRG